MTLVLIEEGLIFGGLIFKNRGQLGSRYFYTSLKLTNYTLNQWLEDEFPFEKAYFLVLYILISFKECFLFLRKTWVGI